MPRIRCLFGHAWEDWTLYWENFVGGEVRRKRGCANCQLEQDEHIQFGRPEWVGDGENVELAPTTNSDPTPDP